MESIHQLAEAKLISQLIVQQLLQLVEDCPAQAERIVKGLRSLANGSSFDVIKWLESFRQEQQPDLNRNQDTESLEESPLRNEGTVEL